ncbi:hypothetical protein D3C77_696790 [compost metagenome]
MTYLCVRRTARRSLNDERKEGLFECAVMCAQQHNHYGVLTMKTSTRGYLMALASLLLLLLALFVPSSGAGDLLWPVFALSMVLALVVALIAQFGKGRAKNWIEANF